MDREEAKEYIKSVREFYATMEKFAQTKDEAKFGEALDMAIKALSQPNYETDTEVRLAVTNRKKEKVILWDAYGEVEYYPIESLSAEPTDLISRADAMGSVQDHFNDDGFKGYDDGQKMLDRIKSLPSADRPTELLKDGTLKVNVKNGTDVKRVLVWGDDGCGGLYYADDRPSGEWVEKEVVVDEDTDITEWQSAKCSVCGKYHTTPYMYYFDSFNYCPNCGAKMGGDAK